LYGITKAKLKVIRDNSLTASTNGLAIGTDAAVSFYVFTNSTKRLTIDSAGASTFTSTIQATGGKFASANGTTYASTAQLRVDGNGTNNSYAQIVFTDSALRDGKISYYPTATAASSYFSISANQAENDFVLKGDGKLGLGTLTPAYQLQLSGDSAAKPSTNTWTISSDIRVKENINPYIKGLETILKINPVTYDYNGKAGFEKIKDNIGIIAQDVLDILPESISTYKVKLNDNDNEESELYNFNSHALTYVLINAIKEQQAQIEELKALINK
jgi:hypothetical protein